MAMHDVSAGLRQVMPPRQGGGGGGVEVGEITQIINLKTECN